MLRCGSLTCEGQAVSFLRKPVSFVAFQGMFNFAYLKKRTTMDITNILENLGVFVGSGTLFSFITWKATVKGAEADAMEKVQGIYQKLTGDLVKEIERLKTEVELLRQEVNRLSRRSAVACYRRFCISRIYEEEETNKLIEQYEDNQIISDHLPADLGNDSVSHA